MFKKKILLFFSRLIFITLALSLPGKSSAYTVSGIVDLSYRSYESKIGDQKKINNTWSESLSTSLNGYFFDPRLMKFSAGVGYTVYNNSDEADSRLLNYNLNTVFFPGMRVFWTLFGNKSTNTVASAQNIAGYDVTTTNYGGTLTLALGKAGGGRRNNNSNNYNNNNGRWFLPLPDITLSRNHSESESFSSINPLQETRDDTKGRIEYHFNSAMELDFEAGRSKYENLVTRGNYEEDSLRLDTRYRINPNANFTLNGRALNRDVRDMVGFTGSSDSLSYEAMLDFWDRETLRHYYRYSFLEQKSGGVDSVSQVAEAQVQYHLTKELMTYGGLNYSIAQSDSAPQSADKKTIEKGGLLLGATYLKVYQPAFLGPFSFNTAYDLNVGFSKAESQVPTDNSGSGLYYSNRVGFGFASTGWKQDNLSLDYSYYSRRDHSPVGNDTLQHAVHLNAITVRIPRTTLRALGAYQVINSASSQSFQFFTTQSQSNQDQRLYTYDVSADYRITYFLNFDIGTARAETSSSSQTYSLALLPPDTSVVKVYDTLYYAELKMNYAVARNLVYRAALRKELRNGKTVDSENYQLNMNLDYRIRMLFMNFEYRLRQDIFDSTPRATQQYYFAKISRPF